MIRLLLAAAWLIACSACGCTHSGSAQRQQRIDDCLASCQRMQPAAPAGVGPLDPRQGIRDSRTECERECHGVR